MSTKLAQALKYVSPLNSPRIPCRTFSRTATNSSPILSKNIFSPNTFKPTIISQSQSDVKQIRSFNKVPFLLDEMSSSVTTQATPGDVPIGAQVPPVPSQTTTQADEEPDTTLEIKDAAIIFNDVWSKIEKKYGVDNLHFPREIIWLMGAPGAGKSYNAGWILKARSITAKEVVMSSLLTSPEAEKIKREAGLVGDSLVFEILLEKLLQPEYSNGVLVDGFPRTKVQVECIKMLKDKMLQLRQQFQDAKTASYFPIPAFRIAVLFVDEKESVERQLKRGREARDHNQRVRETGSGIEMEERATDFSDELARRRYSIFKDHYSTLQELKKYFTFSVINTKASVNEVRERIYKEFMYQSSLELAQETYDLLQNIPIVSELTQHARQNLVRRLDNYQGWYSDIFKKVISIIQKEFVPVLEKHVLSGEALIRSKDTIFEDALARNIVIDVLAERGYAVGQHTVEERIPKKFDLKTGNIECEVVKTHLFKVRFSIPSIRNDLDYQ